MDDFTGPGQAAIGQITNVLNNEAQNDRAKIYLQAQQRQNMEKNFEVKSTLANHLMATDPNRALELFNDGLRGFGVSVTMDQFHPAMKGFEVVADLMRKNDVQGAQLTLKSLKDRGMLTNLNDAKQALELEQNLRQQQSQQQADTFLRLQHPDIDRAQQTVNAMRGYRQGTVDQTELFRLYGTTDMTAIENKAAQDEAIVQGFEDHANLRQTVQTAFMNNPGLAEDVTKTSLLNMADPEKQRTARISQLLLNPDRTDREEHELNSLALLSNKPQLIDSLGLKNATTEKIRLNRDLEDTGERLGNLQEVRGVLDQAAGAVASIDPKESGLPDGSKPMDEKAAANYARLMTIRLGEGQKFLQDNGNRLQALDQSILSTQQQLDGISKQIVGAPANRKDLLAQQHTELTKSLEASQAMKRLIAVNNPYQLAAQESAVATATDPEEKKQATLTLKQMQQQRTDDLQTVQDESLRLQRRQRLLQGHLSKADRDEDVERRLNQATDAATNAISKGIGRTEAVRNAMSIYGVKAADLNKQIDSVFSDNETQAKTEFSLLPDSMQTSQNAARIGKKWKVSPDKVLEGIKRPNTPLVQIGQEKAEAKTVGEGFGKQYSAIQEADLNSSNQLSKLDRMEQLLSGVQTGALTPAITQVQAIAQSFGLEVDKSLPAKQAMEALTNEIALTLRNPSGGAGMPGALSDKDREFLQSMTPSLSKTPEGNRMIIDTARKLAQRNRDVGKLARAYRKAHGQFDEGFFEQLQTFSDAHPLFKQPDLSQYQEIRTTKDGRRLGRKADGTIEEIR